MLDWKQFFLAYLRSRSRLFVYLISLTFSGLTLSVFICQFRNLLSLLFPLVLLCNHFIFRLGHIGGNAGLSPGTSLWGKGSQISIGNSLV